MKKFWRIVIMVAILVIVLIAFSHCAAKKEIVVEKQPEVQIVEKPKLSFWTQDLDENIAVGDPIIFHNQWKIIVAGKIPVKIKSYHDGKLAVKDSSITFDFSIPAETKGKLVKVLLTSGKPSAFTVEFTEGDPNYQHTFYVKPDKTFSLGSKTTIYLDGKPYSVNLGIVGDGTGKCRLMYESEYSSSESNVGGAASGVPDVIGTKIIKKQ